MTAAEQLAALEVEVVGCRACPRLVAWREQVAVEKRAAYRDETYWGRPIPGFGDPAARIAVVGLAPAAHGANRTGRVFTGDRSGDFLYASLFRTESRWGLYHNRVDYPEKNDEDWFCHSILSKRDGRMTAEKRAVEPYLVPIDESERDAYDRQRIRQHA